MSEWYHNLYRPIWVELSSKSFPLVIDDSVWIKGNKGAEQIPPDHYLLQVEPVKLVNNEEVQRFGYDKLKTY